MCHIILHPVAFKDYIQLPLWIIWKHLAPAGATCQPDVTGRCHSTSPAEGGEELEEGEIQASKEEEELRRKLEEVRK